VRVAVIGNFDGVHRGHRGLLQHARSIADGVPASRVVAVTFDPHPMMVLRPDRAPAALTGAQRRADLLREAGADDVVVLAFTPELAASSPADFARLLREAPDIDADVVVVGENFRFGAQAAGDTGTLTALGAELGFTVDVVPLMAGTPDEAHAWSSTAVRDLIARGDMAGAAAALGRPHRLEGTVVRGDQRGRTLGYPTANVEVEGRLAVPSDGVYAGWLVLPSGERLPAAASIGTNPQFAGSERRVEAYVLDRDDLELYGVRVGLDLVQRLRGQAVFGSVTELVEQMGRDVAGARAALAG